MKDFPYWHGAIYSAKTALILKAVGEELEKYQNQLGLFGGDIMKLTIVQMAILRKQYSEKTKKLEGEALPGHPPGKPEFNK
jgi:hypothetical protein